MMKYEKPEIESVLFTAEEILTTSATTITPPTQEGQEMGPIN